jgi:hypothetical protein
MTIIVSLSVPEGIILAADTQTTLLQNDIPVNSFKNTQKIFSLSTETQVFGIAQFGVANPGGKPLSSHIFSLREIIKKIKPETPLSLENITDVIINYFAQFALKDIEGLGFFLAGFEHHIDQIENCVYFISFGAESDGKALKKEKKNPQQIAVTRELVLNGSNFGLQWAGEGTWILDKLLNLSTDNTPPAKIPYQHLSLKDGTEVCAFMINTVIGFEKYLTRFPSCGGELKMAYLTPREFKFINVKPEDLFI